MGKTILQVNENGDLIIPSELAYQYGLVPGAQVVAEPESDTLVLHRALTLLNRVDIEVTNTCNLACSICIRRYWNAPMGHMAISTYEKIMADLQYINPRPTVFLGGYGEPLCHPEIVEFVSMAKAIGARVEMITNGTLLTKELSADLIDAGLDLLWVSLDGITDAANSENRAPDNARSVIENLRQLILVRHRKNLDRVTTSCCSSTDLTGKPELGLAFVAGRKNINELPHVVALAESLSIRKLSISNLLAFDEDIKENLLYKNSLCWRDGSTGLNLPPMDWNDTFGRIFTDLASLSGRMPATGNGRERLGDTCPFVEKGSLSIRWDGKVSPCWPLLYSHESYLGDRPRRSTEFFVGTVLEQSVQQIWDDPAYLSLRRKIGEFQFAPCVQCNNCEMADHNMEDCIGNEHPGCGGCLWAQGFIVCP